MAIDRNHYQRKPPGPMAGFWSWRYLDLIKTLRLVTNPRIKAFYERFGTLFPPGSKFPEINLETADGRRINTRDLLGKKHFVLTTGAIT